MAQEMDGRWAGGTQVYKQAKSNELKSGKTIESHRRGRETVVTVRSTTVGHVWHVHANACGRFSVANIIVSIERCVMRALRYLVTNP